MIETQTGKFILEQADFQTDQQTGLLSMTVSRDYDWSFSKDGVMLVPDSIIEGASEAICLFSVAPDTMYRHEPVDGENGRSLPMQETILAKSLLHTDIGLKRGDADHLPPREQDDLQRIDFPLGSDESCHRILVAGHVAYSGDDPVVSPPVPLKFPKNNARQCNVTFFCRMQNRNAYDELAWMPPLRVRFMIWRASEGMNESEYLEASLSKTTWEEEGSKSTINVGSNIVWSDPFMEGLGYQYSMFRDDDKMYWLKVYRETNWEDAREYAFHFDLSPMSGSINSYFESNPNGMICIRMKYADQKDSIGRMLWRGWTPTASFRKNTPPSPPYGLTVNEA